IPVGSNKKGAYAPFLMEDTPTQ
ncbi:MAG: hypothetical protein RLZZ205_27, partial [Bacteroidota bacterium]